MKRFFSVTLLLVFLAVAGGAEARIAPWEIDALVDRPAPDFRLATTDNNTLTLADLTGRVILLNFWATWCSPCRHEMPALERLHQRFAGRNFSVVGIAVDDNRAAVRSFLKQMPVNFPVLFDSDQKTADTYKVFAYPTTFLIDSAGVIRRIFTGEQEWESEEIVGRINRLLTSPGSGTTAPRQGSDP